MTYDNCSIIVLFRGVEYGASDRQLHTMLVRRSPYVSLLFKAQKAGQSLTVDRCSLPSTSAKYSAGKHLQSPHHTVGIPEVLRHN